MREIIIGKWSSLADREKQVLLVGGFFLILFLFYISFWSPFLERNRLLRKKIIENQKTLAWMQAADQVLQNKHPIVKNEKTNLQPLSLLSLTQQAVDAANLTTSLKSLKQINNKAIELQFNQVEFDQLIQFVMTLINQYALTISQFSVKALNSEGLVQASMVIG